MVDTVLLLVLVVLYERDRAETDFLSLPSFQTEKAVSTAFGMLLAIGINDSFSSILERNIKN